MKKKPLTIGSLRPNYTNTHVTQSFGKNINNDKVDKSIEKPTKFNPSVEFIHYNEKYVVEAQKNNKTLLDNALDSNIPMKYKCKKGKCGECIVNISKGNELLSTITENEVNKLKDKIKINHRLACQTFFDF